MHLFVTGSGTEVGKTYVTCLMLRALRACGRRAVGFKPVCCGPRDDVVLLQEAGDPEATPDEINPVWLRTPAAPFVAAQFENRSLTAETLAAGFAPLAARFDHVLAEGAGGWEVPLGVGQSMSDVAVALGLPVLVVVDNRLGALNTTILTVRAIEARGLRCAGIVLNHLEDERDIASVTNRSVLEDWLGVPVLEDVLHDETETDPAWVRRLFGI